ncbi:hypothetical protein MBLNU459_g2554t2 [Dothideomycetes sp. NU459]
MPLLRSTVLFGAAAAAAAAARFAAAAAPPGANLPPWDLGNFTTLVAFGDSYTDDSRLGYFGAHNGSAPPPGWVDPANYDSADGGRVWPQYVKQYTGVDLYNYAVSGAVCSNAITPRTWTSINADFPAVAQYEVPAYLADSAVVEPGGANGSSNGTTMFLVQDPATTVYSFWIGTNDLGSYALLTDSQVPGTNIVTYLDCVYDQVQRVYDNGGRYFVLQNVAPLQLTALYGLPGEGGVEHEEEEEEEEEETEEECKGRRTRQGSGKTERQEQNKTREKRDQEKRKTKQLTVHPPNPGPNHYWPDKPANLTEIHYRMLEQVVLVNAVYAYRTPFALDIARRYPGARFAVMDMYGLFADIHAHPAQYLNGTAPLNVTGFDQHCNLTGGDCVRSADPDSFLWFDELHPSEQTERVIARTFVDVVRGVSPWASYWAG